jgi:hypothetical protein
VLQSATVKSQENFREKRLVLLRLKSFTLLAFLLLASLSLISAQETSDKGKKKEKQNNKTKAAEAGKNATAEQVAESAILIYGSRANLNQIRKTTVERGKISIVNAEGKTEQANYGRLVLRADNLEKERIRFDQEFPNAKYALIFNNNKVFGLYNDAVFSPREDASKAFENQIWHGLEALLRYKENESKLELAGNEKISGIDLYRLDVTDKQNRKTRFYISTKSLRVMMLEYTEGETKYRRRFYDYNYAQGTLVPYRTVLWANDKQIEEIEVQTVSFGQKIEEDAFQAG